MQKTFLTTKLVLKIKTSRGFSLYELIFTLSIVGILMVLAAPSFQSTIQQNQLTASTSELHTALSLSRSEAIKRASFMTLCASTDLLVCNNSTDWSNGWILFMDNDGDGVFEDNGNAVLCENNDDCLIKVWDNLSNNMTLSADVSSITFDLNGVPLAIANYTATSSNQTTQITVNSTGRANVSH